MLTKELEEQKDKVPTPFDQAVDKIFERHKLSDSTLRETIKNALLAAFEAGLLCR